MLSFRTFFRVWPVVLGAVLFGLAIRLTNGGVPTSASEQSPPLAIGPEPSFCLDPAPIPTFSGVGRRHAFQPLPFSYPRERLGSTE
jgi:hypothetical protein